MVVHNVDVELGHLGIGSRLGLEVLDPPRVLGCYDGPIGSWVTSGLVVLRDEVL